MLYYLSNAENIDNLFVSIFCQNYSLKTNIQ